MQLFLVTVLVSVLAWVGATGDSTSTTTLTAVLSGLNEVGMNTIIDDPSLAATVSGKIDLVFEETQICFNAELQGNYSNEGENAVGEFILGHIHVSPFGIAGPIIIVLFDFAAGLPADIYYDDHTHTTSVKGCTTDVMDAMFVTTTPVLYYINLHTSMFMGGALRGQLFNSSY